MNIPPISTDTDVEMFSVYITTVSPPFLDFYMYIEEQLQRILTSLKTFFHKETQNKI